jgi:integrase
MATKYVNQMVLNNGIRPPKSGAVRFRVRHCPSLYLRVSASGAASWAVFYRINGKLTKETLGKLKDIPKVEDAVARAQASKRKAREGVNPVGERRGSAAKADANTVGAAVGRWLREHVERNLRPKTVGGYRQLFEHDILPRWADRALGSIAKSDILALLAEKAGTRERTRKDATGGAVIQSNRLLTRLRSFFGWAVGNDLITVNPTNGVRFVAKEQPRDRYLDDDQIRLFWAATNDMSSWSVLFRLALLTGQRSRGELGQMTWSEIDVENRLWTIPAKRSKNGKAHVVHLSALAMAQLQALPRERDRLFTGGSFSRAKSRIDATMGVIDWVTHDLRRTATTLMAQIGVAPHVADRVLNHQGGVIRGVAATYNRFTYLDERKAALEALGEHVAKLVGANVEKFEPKRA